MDSILETQSLNPKFDLMTWIHSAQGACGNLIESLNATRLHSVSHHIDNLTILYSTLKNLSAVDSEFLHCRIVQCNFVDSDFNTCAFRKCYFKETRFNACSLRNVLFEDCVFEDCSFDFSRPIEEGSGLIFSRALLSRVKIQDTESQAPKAISYELCRWLDRELIAPVQNAAKLSIPDVVAPPPVASLSPAASGPSRFDQIER